MKKLFIVLIGFLLLSCSTQAQLDLLIYYGYPSSFNYPVNAWSVANVVNDMKKYDLIVFGDGLQFSSHPDHSNLESIVSGLDTTANDPEIYGYVTSAQDCCDFISECLAWDSVGVDGIFLDESGYDFGYDREDFNLRVDVVHSLGLKVFANAWNLDHILTVDDDPAYPNLTFNPDSLATSLNTTDWVLLESYLVNTLSYPGGYELRSQWLSRTAKLVNYNVQVAGVAVIDNGDIADQFKFDYVYGGAVLDKIDAIGSSDHYYGASSSVVEFYSRVINTLDLSAGDKMENDSTFYREIGAEILEIDFQKRTVVKLLE